MRQHQPIFLRGRGPRRPGCPAEHFGHYLAQLAADDRRKREEEALPPDQVARWAAAMRRFDVPPEQCLTRQEASAAFRQTGLDPRTSGSWAMHGWITRDGDRRYLTAKGKEWLARHDAAQPAQQRPVHLRAFACE